MTAAEALRTRLILTGQAQNQNFDASAFKNTVCSKIFGLFNCANGVYELLEQNHDIEAIIYRLLLEAAARNY